jgi:carboxymethylenebutenolidase
MVEFQANGDRADGYLAVPASGAGPGVLVIQEWWGLVPQIKRVCDRLAGEGFTALAPDLFHGDIAEHTEMDKAEELMNALPPERAARDMSAAISYLLANPAARGDAVGVVGFCMGGLLAFLISAQEGARVRATVAFYGAPLGEGAPDVSALSASVLGHFAEEDTFFPAPAARELEAELKGLGKDVTFHFYPGCGHGFANEENPLGTHSPEHTPQAWARTIAFLRETLD